MTTGFSCWPSRPTVVWLRRGVGAGLPLMPAFRPLVRYAVLHHIHGVTQELQRRYHRHAALEPTATDWAALDCVDHFRQSLPDVPVRRLLLLFAVSAGLTSTLLATVFQPPMSTFMQEAWVHLATLNVTALLTAIVELDGEPGISAIEATIAFVAVVLMVLSFYLPLRLAEGSFRLGRATLSSYPAAPKVVLSNARRMSRHPDEAHVHRLEPARCPRSVPVRHRNCPWTCAAVPSSPAWCCSWASASAGCRPTGPRSFHARRCSAG